MTGKIRTVMGDIDPKTNGITDTHDHLIRTGGIEVREHKDFLMDSVEAGAAEFNDYLEAGGKTMVCMDPIGAGRNVPKMLEIAKQFKGKGNIIMTTGFHKARFYDTRNSFLATVPVDEVVKMTVAEIEEGMDIHSYNGPVVKRVKAKAGIIKAATGYDGIHPFELKSLEVAAKTSMQTGCPILVHTQLGTSGFEVSEILQGHGVSPDRIAISHINKNPSKRYWKKVMDTGVFLSIDGPDRVKYFPDEVQAENIKWLVDQGYQKQMMLAMDAGRTYYHKHYSELRGGHKSLGIPYLLTRFVPLLREIGVPEDAIEDILVNNPRKWLTFIDKK
ncbi:MAG: phosphotriesterase [Mycoplasmatales bacterium]|nr:phosphotriesterase [Mycoplasmatales bacterium]